MSLPDTPTTDRSTPVAPPGTQRTVTLSLDDWYSLCFASAHYGPNGNDGRIWEAGLRLERALNGGDAGASSASRGEVGQ